MANANVIPRLTSDMTAEVMQQLGLEYVVDAYPGGRLESASRRYRSRLIHERLSAEWLLSTSPAKKHAATCFLAPASFYEARLIQWSLVVVATERFIQHSVSAYSTDRCL